MSPDLISSLADAALPICAGVYMTLLGHRVVGKKPGTNIRYDEWHARFGRRFQIFGPVLIIVGLVLLSISLARPIQRVQPVPRAVQPTIP